MSVPTRSYVLTLSCPDAPGIVAAVTRVLFEQGGNIDESQQFGDPRTGRFFMRIRFSVGAGGPEEPALHHALVPLGGTLSMDWQLRDASAPYRALLMVSRFGHCLNDLLFRWRSGALTMDVPLVVSNHRRPRAAGPLLRRALPPHPRDGPVQARGGGPAP